jgi:hypothetical protein
MAVGAPPERVMLVRAGLPDGGVSVGSGTLVAERLVLTAAHVVFDDGGMPLRAIHVGPPGLEVLPAARVLWPGRHVPGGSRDAALLEIAEGSWVPPRWLGPVRWGRLTGRAGNVSCEAIGFPRVLRDPDGTRVEDQISAQINPGTARSVGARYDLHVTSSAPLTPPGGQYPSPWSGASGAGVFSAGLLVGVIVIDTPGFDHDRLTAASINPDSYAPFLARSLSNLAARCSELGRPADALPDAEKAVAIYRELASSNPRAHRLGLAMALTSIGEVYLQSGRQTEAESASAEARALRESS